MQWWRDGRLPLGTSTTFAQHAGGVVKCCTEAVRWEGSKVDREVQVGGSSDWGGRGRWQHPQKWNRVRMRWHRYSRRVVGRRGRVGNRNSGGSRRWDGDGRQQFSDAKQCVVVIGGERGQWGRGSGGVEHGGCRECL